MWRRHRDEDKSAILDAALELAQTQISAQVADDASLDGRTTGLVGLNGALLAGDLTAKDGVKTLQLPEPQLPHTGATGAVT